MRYAFTALVAIGLITPAAFAQTSSSGYYALAYSEAAPAYGFAARKATKNEADTMALKACQHFAKAKGGCRLTNSGQRPIAVVSCWERGRMTAVLGVEEGRTGAEAATKALQQADKGAQCAQGAYRLNW